ncbi:MAG TPA: DinB family protein [Candidatus Limnocylindrales bacterium]|nr:DinB family protein [Candidatus Limnocylindrales bacterium]
MTDPAALAVALRSAAADLAALEPAVLGAAPWPLAARFDHSDEAAWGPPEVLAHVDEMLPYWMGQVARIVAAPRSAPAPFGRQATDAVRAGIIERDRELPLEELFGRVALDADRAAESIERLSPEDLERIGRHPVRGEMRVGEIVDRFVVGHLAEHVHQLRDVIEGRGRLPSA